MNRIFTLIILAAFSAFGAHAQTQFGIRAGVNHSTLKGDAVSGLEDLMELTNGYLTTTGKTGVHAGVYASVPLSGAFGIESGVYYSQKGYQVKGTIAADKLDFLNATAKATLQSHYIDIPLYLKGEIAKGLSIYAGPQLSYLVKNDVRIDAGALGVSVFNKKFDVTDQFNKVDLGVSGGLGYTFENGLSVHAGYDHGLTRMDKNENLKSFNRNVKVGIGFRF